VPSSTFLEYGKEMFRQKAPHRLAVMIRV